jgi:hypothetical protein
MVDYKFLLDSVNKKFHATKEGNDVKMEREKEH